MADPFNIEVKFKDDVFEIKPYKVKPDKVGTPDQVTLVWELKDSGGSVFPQKPTDSGDAIEFKDGGPPDPVWTKESLKWTVTYAAPATAILWRYTVRVKKADGTIIGFDPEVDNVRPGPGTIPEETKEKKTKEKDADRDED
jgi:hypothetical protein